jgi:outer membrane protein insertion porin family
MRTLISSVIVILVLGFCVSCTEGSRRRGPGGPIVKEIRVTGADHFSGKKIKNLMRTKQSKFLRTKRLRESTLESDLFSIAAFYRRNGFLEAQVSHELTHDEVMENVWIQIVVQEGDQITVSDVLFEGNDAVPDEALMKIVDIRAGQPLNEKQVGDDAYKIYIYYADRGYVFGSISHETDITGVEATVKYTIDEGAPAGIDRIDVRGNNRVSEGIVRREVVLKPGDTFSRKELLNSQQSLYDTGFFKDVEIEPVRGEVDPLSVDLLVKVRERKMREVSFALGYGTRDETRVTVGWLHRNLRDSGRQLELRTILASKDYDKGLTRKRGDVSLTDRWFFGRRLVGGAAIFGQESLEEYEDVEQGEYTLVRVGADLSVKKDFSRFTRLALTYTHEIVDISKPNWPVEDTEDLRISLDQEINRSASFLVERDTRLPFFDPQGGSLTRLVGRRSGGFFGGDNSYYKMTWSWARYHPFHGRSMIAFSTRVGHAEAFGKSREKGVPEYERFSAGGSSTIRGYDEREFGPGDFLLLVNVEFRFALVWKFVGVAFFDMGNSWPSVRDVRRTDFDFGVPADEFPSRRDSDVKYSVGMGLGVQTPVGPARVDYGFRLKRGFLESGRKESPGMFHITVGHSF